jgi:uncharacterized cupin superfamily protein
MRVSPRELKAVRAGGLVTRYAILGQGVFVIVDLPEGGTAGTPVEDACELEHWGLVLQGEVALEAAGRQVFGPGNAFYVRPGAPAHHFRAARRAVIAGFAPVTEPVDDSPGALKARGIEVVRRVSAPTLPPPMVTIKGTPVRTASIGQIETEAAEMGAWLFTRTTFGRLSGYTDGWCDLPHWGLVLDGDLILRWEDGEIELLGPGDAFHSPAGPPGHRIEVADLATIIDYTPIAAIDDEGRRRAPQSVATRPAPDPGGPSREHRSGSLIGPKSQA